MKNNEIVKALRATESRSKRELLDAAADLIEKLTDRCARYEDTGLTPERCAEFARADAEGRYIIMRDAEQEGVARLREIAEADKDGRVVVLPKGPEVE